MKSKGSILVAVMIFIFITMIVVAQLFDSTQLQLKMSHQFRLDSEHRLSSLKQLERLECELEKGACLQDSCEWIQFAPDTLGNRYSGVNYYRLKSDYKSYYAVRSFLADEFSDPKQNYLQWHGFSVVDNKEENTITIIDLQTFYEQKRTLQKVEPDSDAKACSRLPLVLVRAPREKKRKIIVMRENEFWAVEMALDEKRLGRRMIEFP